MDKYTEGLAEGEARGIEKIAINMLIVNKPMDEIMLFTGLSEQTIAKLKNEIE